MDVLYEAIADGSVDPSVVEQLSLIASALEHGDHQRALHEHKQMTQAHGMDDVGQKLIAIKSLCSIVKQLVDKRQW